MRDLAVLFLFIFLIIYTIRRPYIGVCAWIWIALAYPAGWAWGFSTSLRLNFTIAILTVLSYLMYKKKPKVKFDVLSFLIVVLWFIALISSLASNSLLSDFIWNKFSEFSKIIALYFAVILILRKKLHIDTLLWSIVLSVSSFAGMEAGKYLLSGGGHAINGYAGHILGDRNDLAVAINMCLPIIVYLNGQTKHQMLKYGLTFLLVLNVIAIVGTGSRGGFVGLVMISLFFFWKSNRKFLMVISLAIVIPIGYQLAPSDWSDRMSTVKEANTDSSFIGRLWAWKISVKIANDNFWGNGFYATQDPIAWHKYKTGTENFMLISTPTVPDDLQVKAAHSIYFQVIGDFGYIGFSIFLLMLLLLLVKIYRIRSLAKARSIPWCEHLTTMLIVSFVGYLVTGANVSMAYFDLLYVFMGMTIVMKRAIEEQPETRMGNNNND